MKPRAKARVQTPQNYRGPSFFAAEAWQFLGHVRRVLVKVFMWDSTSQILYK